MKQVINEKHSPPKLLYIENIRIILTILVIIVHVACTYGGPGGWSYIERGAGIGTILPLTIINATSQSFFMGMFFFIAAYFTHLSFQKKGFLKFTKERLIRLGIPLLITIFFVSVLTSYLAWPARYPKYADFSFHDIWSTGKAFGVGVMWFVVALFYFTILYIIAYYLIPALRTKSKKKLPAIRSFYILLTAILVGIVTFLVRMNYPLFKGTGSEWMPFNLGHFPQYIFLFILGVIAARYNSDFFISFKRAKRWAWLVLALMLVAFPIIFFLGEAHTNGIKAFTGRGTWQSLAFAIWEQLIGFAIMVSLLGILKAKWNKQCIIARNLSKSAYAVYVLHPPVLVGISVLFINWKADLLLKFLAITPLAIIGSFGIALLVKHAPLLKRIF